MSQAVHTIEQRDGRATASSQIVYPDSDGKPMADNTKQFQYIITIEVGLDSMFADDPDVFVAGDLLWYPVEGRSDISKAPDVLVAFGRPKGHRGSYKQWLEGGVAPQVVFEILSPGNTEQEMLDKREFYERYGVREYCEYDPDGGSLEVWQREGVALKPVMIEGEWRSPLLGVRLKLEADGELSVFRPDGRKFMRPVDLDLLVEQEQRRAERERRRAERERRRAEHERVRAEKLAARLRELGIDPDSLVE